MNNYNMNKINFFIFFLFFINNSFSLITNSNNQIHNQFEIKLRDNNNYDIDVNSLLYKILFFENILLLFIFHNSI